MKQTKPFEKCPICGGELEEKEVEKLLKGGVHIATLKVKADVLMFVSTVGSACIHRKQLNSLKKSGEN